MDLKIITDQQKNEYNNLVTHVVQSWEWGEFRKALGLPVLRYGLFDGKKLRTAFQLTLHKIPFTNKYMGYLPKGPFPNHELASALLEIGKKYNCAAIKIEPNIIQGIKNSSQVIDKKFIRSNKPMFTKYNYCIDLTKPEEALLRAMHPKSRYNIKVAQKHGVWVEERIDDGAFKIYLKLYFDTTKRQGYLGHDKHYHRLVWETLKKYKMVRLLIAFYSPEGSKKPLPLNAWMLFNFKNTLYYPYGGSSVEYKNVMAPNLVAWEAIKLGKKLKLKNFDLWGAASPDAQKSDPFLGFTQFKEKLGGELIEYIGSFDVVINQSLFALFNQINQFTHLKALLLKIIKR